MIKKIRHLMFNLFIANRYGWFLVMANFAVIYLLIWSTEGIIETQMPSNGVAYRTTILSPYNFSGGGLLGGLSDVSFLLAEMLNSPALSLSNWLSSALSLDAHKLNSSLGSGIWSDWLYLSHTKIDIFFIVIQWLIVGAIIKRLFRMVKESD